jgi:hypothetical protein
MKTPHFDLRLIFSGDAVLGILLLFVALAQSYPGFSAFRIFDASGVSPQSRFSGSKLFGVVALSASEAHASL